MPMPIILWVGLLYYSLLIAIYGYGMLNFTMRIHIGAPTVYMYMYEYMYIMYR